MDTIIAPSLRAPEGPPQAGPPTAEGEAIISPVTRCVIPARAGIQHFFYGLIVIFFFFLSLTTAVRAEETRIRVVKDLVFDKKAKTITYTLTAPAHVRIRLGVNEGPMYTTLLNWENREIGTHVEHYTGFDGDNTVFTLHFYTADDADTYGLDLYEILPQPEQVIVGKALPAARLNQMHKTHRREFCHDLNAQTRFDSVRVKNGTAMIRRKIPLVIDLDKDDKLWFTRERFQVHIFLDDVLVHQDLDGYVPYVWNFDPKGINSGQHTIIVNLSGFADHIATAVLPVIIEK